ncbi:hypothetical protein GR925_27530 [Streptomyces sp. HUCO-GS316]|uniref:hypothetical protein n=1 Tax=Streptomyces sp. HUCO-GS316 TaxID=2692198 RepID=UPI0013722C60|nr:hypothetical protein [Streptomyces sp. HUCO-GS316]MXM67081.1 hypothetical protein [Streptomyces sp. HUCO-GS316]
MAVRGTPAQGLPDNPLGGVLRDLSRRSRSTTKRRGSRPTVVEGPQGKPGPAGERGPAGRDGTVVTAVVVLTDEDGRAVVELPEVEDGRELVLTALATVPEGAGDVLAWAALETVGTELAVLRVWAARPLEGPAAAVPVGAGVAVHVTAVPAGS